MDIVIAAAGQGTRMQQYTKEIPKHIIEVAGRPFLYYLLDAVVAAHFRRIIIVGGHHYDKLFSVIKNYESEGVEIITVDQTGIVPKDMYGTACPLLAVEDIVQGDRFVYTMGDHLLSAEDLEHMQMSTFEMLVASYEHSEPERYGVIEETDQQYLRRIVEKPDSPINNHVNVGLYTLTRQVFPLIHNLQSSQRGEYEITDVINQLAHDKEIRVVPLNGYWLDLGRPEDIDALENFLSTSHSSKTSNT